MDSGQEMRSEPGARRDVRGEESEDFEFRAGQEIPEQRGCNHALSGPRSQLLYESKRTVWNKSQTVDPISFSTGSCNKYHTVRPQTLDTYFP